MALPPSDSRWIAEWASARRVAWRSVGLAVAAAIALRELGLLLGAIESSGGQSYTASVFTGPSLAPRAGASNIADALTVWSADPRSWGWIYCHLLIDLVAFTPAYCRVLYLVMGAVGLPRLRARNYALALLAIDTVETACTWVVLSLREDGLYWLIPALYTVTWVAVLVVVVVIVVAWAGKRFVGPISASHTLNASGETLKGGPPGPAMAIRGLIVLVGLFLALVALPAGGPLEQLPDVLRAQLSSVDVLFSVLALLLFVGALIVAGWRSTPPASDSLRPAPHTSGVLIVFWAPAIILVVIAFLAGSSNWPAALALPSVVTALVVADGVREWSLIDPLPGPFGNLITALGELWRASVRTVFRPRSSAHQDSVADAPSLSKTWQAFVRALGLGLLAVGPALWAALRTVVRVLVTSPVAIIHAVRAFLVRLAKALREHPTPQAVTDGVTTSDREVSGRLWIGGVAGAVVVGSGLGLLRAAFRPMVVGSQAESTLPWLVWVVVGVVVAVFGGLLTQWLVDERAAWLQTPSHTRALRFGACAVVVVLAVCVMVIAVWPHCAGLVGTSGTIALCLGFLALIVGELHHLARTRDVWPVTHRLGLGARTPWLGVVITGWLLTSVFNTSGGYHDARVTSASPTLNHTYTNIHDAWKQWQKTAVASGCVQDGQPLKMLMVAASGGGIRASYWTAAALDRLVPADDPCGRARIFAVSGVSGGSFGTATWLQAPTGQAREWVETLSQDSALAASTAALFLRDLPQPFTGLTRPWRDRAAVMEDAWAEAAHDLFGKPGTLRPWSEVGNGKNWKPVVVLNGSSVTDGCRVLVTNVGQLPAAAPDCRSATPSDLSGPTTGTLDATHGLASDLDDDGDGCKPTAPGGQGDIGIVTAALLSARFPLVSPSGVLERCLTATPGGDGEVTATYSVDGGYYDNSGLLSLLAIWNAVAADVRSCTGCPAVEPWIVVLDNHYRSMTVRPPESRQYELMIPLRTLLSASEATSQERLEQAAAVTMDTFRNRTGTAGQVIRIGPQNGPGMSAPLGWVLSRATRCDLDAQLKMAFESNASARMLLPVSDILPRPCPPAAPK